MFILNHLPLLKLFLPGFSDPLLSFLLVLVFDGSTLFLYFQFLCPFPNFWYPQVSDLFLAHHSMFFCVMAASKSFTPCLICIHFQLPRNISSMDAQLIINFQDTKLNWLPKGKPPTKWFPFLTYQFLLMIPQVFEFLDRNFSYFLTILSPSPIISHQMLLFLPFKLSVRLPHSIHSQPSPHPVYFRSNTATSPQPTPLP